MNCPGVKVAVFIIVGLGANAEIKEPRTGWIGGIFSTRPVEEGLQFNERTAVIQTPVCLRSAAAGVIITQIPEIDIVNVCHLTAHTAGISTARRTDVVTPIC